MLIETLMRALKIEDRSGWPRAGEVRVGHNSETGLPMVDWLEGQWSSPQACYVTIDRGTPVFVVRDAGSGRAMQMRHTNPGLKTKSAAWLLIAALCAVPFAIAYYSSLSYRYGDDTPPLAVFMGALVYELILLGIGFFAYAVWRMVQVRKGVAAPIDGTYERRPWTELQGFRLSDERSEYGEVERGPDGKERQPGIMLLADFGTSAPPIVVTGRSWTTDVMAELHRVLTREFIEQRSERLTRLAAAERAARQAGAGPREKVI